MLASGVFFSILVEKGFSSVSFIAPKTKKHITTKRPKDKNSKIRV
ncbi:hypothetical Protein psc4_05770 [Candidatus Phytoplasma solani]